MAALIAPLLSHSRTLDDRPFDQSTDEPIRAAIPDFEVVLVDGTTERIGGASAYAQEGQMTTFFRTGDDDPIIDAWSERLTSIRTADIKLLRRRDASESSQGT